MLNPFPIQFLSQVAHLFLRVALGAVLMRMGLTTIRESHRVGTPLTHTESSLLWCVGVVEVISGTLFIIGLYTQIAALATMVAVVVLSILKRKMTHFTSPSRSFLLLLGASAVSLFITGAGILAFDLPI